MKILSASQIKVVDQFTIQNEPVLSIDLMERAAKACVEQLVKLYDQRYSCLIICGPGNNGGDGLAIARLLAALNYNVQVIAIGVEVQASQDRQTNLERWKRAGGKVLNDFSEANPFHFVIDALFGAGLNRVPEGIYASLIHQINGTRVPVVAIDIPSGLFSDSNENNDLKCVIRAAHTFTFQCPKLTQLLPESGEFVGQLHILDIGLHPAILNNTATENYFTTVEDVKQILLARSQFAHKGTCGHALMMAGSAGMSGAAILASKATMRSGVGLCTAFIPDSNVLPMQCAIPEVIVKRSQLEETISSEIDFAKYDVVAIGPGIGTSEAAAQALKNAIANSGLPIVIDADAINILSEHKMWLEYLPHECVLTPHPAEFDRLFGAHESTEARLKTLRLKCMTHRCVIVLKGAYTAVGLPNGTICFNSSGNAGMATAGSGDVLTGIITGLMAQGYTAKNAAIIGVYLHGLAGDIVISVSAEESLIASDIIENLGAAFRFVREH